MEKNLKIVFVGHVDHGKSTVIGRLLADNDAVPRDKIEKVRKNCERNGKPFEYAFLLDALQEEQDQGITIDIVKLYFQSEKANFTIIDAPGHKEFLKNMISGASQADAALLIVDAKEGVKEQTRRHGYMLSLLGIKQVVVVINKMDLVDYSEEKFENLRQELRDFLALLNVKPVAFVPISAREGEGVTKKSAQMAWHKSGFLMQVMEELSTSNIDENLKLRIPVQDVYKFSEQRIIAGRIESGKIKKGDTIKIMPGGIKTKVKELAVWSAKEKNSACNSESVSLVLEDDLFLERGQVIVDEDSYPLVGNIFSATVFWLSKEPLTKDKKYLLRLATQEVEAEIFMIKKSLNSSSLEIQNQPEEIQTNEVGEVIIKTSKAFVMDNFGEMATMGRFVLVENHIVRGGGIVCQSEELENRIIGKERENLSIRTKKAGVSLEERIRKNGYTPKVLWLCGLPGSGRNTIAKGLERMLFEMGYNALLITGSQLRYGLSGDLGFKKEDSHTQQKRLSEIAKIVMQSGSYVIISSVSANKKERELAKKLIGEEFFLEVIVDCDPKICAKRYGKNVEIEFEKSESPNIIINTSSIKPEEAVKVAEEKIREIINVN